MAPSPGRGRGIIPLPPERAGPRDERVDALVAALRARTEDWGDPPGARARRSISSRQFVRFPPTPCPMRSTSSAPPARPAPTRRPPPPPTSPTSPATEYGPAVEELARAVASDVRRDDRERVIARLLASGAHRRLADAIASYRARRAPHLNALWRQVRLEAEHADPGPGDGDGDVPGVMVTRGDVEDARELEKTTRMALERDESAARAAMRVLIAVARRSKDAATAVLRTGVIEHVVDILDDPEDDARREAEIERHERRRRRDEEGDDDDDDDDEADADAADADDDDLESPPPMLPAPRDVHDAALELLSAITTPDGDGDDDAPDALACDALLAADGLRKLLAMVARGPRDETSHRAAEALANVAADASIKMAFARIGIPAFKALKSMTRRGRKLESAGRDGPFLIHVARCWSRLLRGDAACKRTFTDAGCVKPVLRLFANRGERDPLAPVALRVLTTLLTVEACEDVQRDEDASAALAARDATIASQIPAAISHAVDCLGNEFIREMRSKSVRALCAAAEGAFPACATVAMKTGFVREVRPPRSLLLFFPRAVLFVLFLLTLVPIRPRRRGERRSLRTFPGASLRPSLGFINSDAPRRLAPSSTDAPLNSTPTSFRVDTNYPHSVRASVAAGVRAGERGGR